MEVPVELQQRYVEHRKRDLQACHQSLAGNNYGELEKIGHQLKGNGATFGHPTLSVIGRKLERGAFQRDKHEIEEALRLLEDWLRDQLS